MTHIKKQGITYGQTYPDYLLQADLKEIAFNCNVLFIGKKSTHVTPPFYI